MSNIAIRNKESQEIVATYNRDSISIIGTIGCEEDAPTLICVNIYNDSNQRIGFDKFDGNIYEVIEV